MTDLYRLASIAAQARVDALEEATIWRYHHRNSSPEHQDCAVVAMRRSYAAADAYRASYDAVKDALRDA